MKCVEWDVKLYFACICDAQLSCPVFLTVHHDIVLCLYSSCTSSGWPRQQSWYKVSFVVTTLRSGFDGVGRQRRSYRIDTVRTRNTRDTSAVAVRPSSSNRDFGLSPLHIQLHRHTHIHSYKWTWVSLLASFPIKKVKAEHIYSASSWEPHHRSIQVWITQLLPCKVTTPAFHLVNIHQTAAPWLVVATIWLQLTTHLLIPEGWKAELALLADLQRTVYPYK